MLFELTKEELKELVEKSLEKRTISGKDGEKLLVNLQEYDTIIDDVADDGEQFKRTILQDDEGILYALEWQTPDGEFDAYVIFDCKFYKVEQFTRRVTDYREIK